MKIKNFKSPLMCIMFSTTLLIASTFTSCQKDESVVPSTADSTSSVNNKGKDIGVVIHDNPDSTKTTGGTTTGGTKGGTTTGTTGGTKGGTTTGGTKGGTTTGTTGGTKGGGTTGGTKGGTTTGTTGGTKGGTTTGTTGGTKGGTTTGTTGGTKGGTTGGTTTGGTKGGTTTGGTTTGGTTTGTNSSTDPTYTTSGPISAKSNTTYSNLLIDLAGSSTTGITVNGATNVHITNCKIINGTGFGINMSSSSNVTVDNTFISNIGFGIYAYQCQSIKVNSNQLLNMNGINTAYLGHAIQFNGVSGSGSQVNNNRIESVTGVALHPHDVINLYQSDGMPGDSIQVIGNWVRGGQMSMWPTSNSGAAGIVIGDVGGSYQICRNNILVNPGIAGIQAQGGNHIKADHNIIYGASTPVSLCGMPWGNWSGASSSDIVYAYNQVKFFNAQGSEVDHFENNANGSVTLIGNTWGANLNASILPDVIITKK